VDRLALFDIDCTLIDGHGAGGRAIMRAIKDVYGVEGELGDYSFHGRTDPGIVRDLADLWGAGGAEAIAGRSEGETQPQVVHDLAERLGTPDDVPAPPEVSAADHPASRAHAPLSAASPPAHRFRTWLRETRGWSPTDHLTTSRGRMPDHSRDASAKAEADRRRGDDGAALGRRL